MSDLGQLPHTYSVSSSIVCFTPLPSCLPCPPMLLPAGHHPRRNPAQRHARAPVRAAGRLGAALPAGVAAHVVDLHPGGARCRRHSDGGDLVRGRCSEGWRGGGLGCGGDIFQVSNPPAPSRCVLGCQLGLPCTHLSPLLSYAILFFSLLLRPSQPAPWQICKAPSQYVTPQVLLAAEKQPTAAAPEPIGRTQAAQGRPHGRYGLRRCDRHRGVFG